MGAFLGSNADLQGLQELTIQICQVHLSAWLVIMFTSFAPSTE